MSDIWTMIWKEWKDFLFSGGRYDYIRPLLNIAILGIVLPLSLKMHWMYMEGNVILIILYIPFIFIITLIGDSIAGERERHTLETLLASRISDRAILLGKVLVAVGFNFGMTVVCLLLGALVVNLSLGLGQWVFYSPISLLLVVLILNFLTLLLAASGGVLISLKSATVRQAAQTMVLAMVFLGMLVYGIARLLPASLTASLTASQIVLILIVILAALDAILLAASVITFQRSRLILG
jgi:ABC-2 type transport system permease protein